MTHTTARYTPEQFARLPKWAQDVMERLQREVTHLQGELSAHNSAAQLAVGSRVKWGWDFMEGHACGTLRSEEQITFTLAQPSVPCGVAVRAALTRECDGIHINGNDTLVVELGAANDMIVRLKRRQ